MIGSFATARLRLRPLLPDDLPLLAELNSDPEVMRYLTGRAASRRESSDELAASLGTRWVAFACDDGAFVGWVAAAPTADGTEYELGWRLARAAWGRGYATEAAGALIAHLFAAGARRVYAQTMATNERSRAVMERLGLRYARTFHLELDDPLPGSELGEVEYERWQDP